MIVALALAVAEAGSALQPFAPPSAPPAAELVPDSVRMRLAMLYVVPARPVGSDGIPWFAQEDVQARIEAMQREEAARPADPASVTWAVAYAGNQWRLTGDAVALRDLQRRFSSEAEPIEAYAPDDRTRLVAALRRAVYAAASSAPAERALVDDIRGAVAAGLQRGTPKALAKLVAEVAPRLSEDEELRDSFAEGLGARVFELDPKTRARLGR